MTLVITIIILIPSDTFFMISSPKWYTERHPYLFVLTWKLQKSEDINELRGLYFPLGIPKITVSAKRGRIFTPNLIIIANALPYKVI